MVSKLLICCKKGKPYLYRQDDDTFKLSNKLIYEDTSDYKKYYGINNRKIVAECDCVVEEITSEKYWHSTEDFDYIYNTGTVYYEDLLKKSCLMDDELDDYLGCEDKGYAIHIKNLNIYDTPKRTSTYNTYNKEGKVHIANIPIYTAPQDMMYAFDYYGTRFVLISIKPKDLCRILNGEQTIVVRKKVLKEML